MCYFQSIGANRNGWLLILLLLGIYVGLGFDHTSWRVKREYRMLACSILCCDANIHAFFVQLCLIRMLRLIFRMDSHDILGQGSAQIHDQWAISQWLGSVQKGWIETKSYLLHCRNNFCHLEHHYQFWLFFKIWFYARGFSFEEIDVALDREHYQLYAFDILINQLLLAL